MIMKRKRFKSLPFSILKLSSEMMTCFCKRDSCCRPGSTVAVVLMDKLGRKVLLIGSFAGMVMVESENHRYLNLNLTHSADT